MSELSSFDACFLLVSANGGAESAESVERLSDTEHPVVLVRDGGVVVDT